VEICDLTDEANLVVRPVSGLRATEGLSAAAQAERLADLVEREWAARYEDVKTETPRTEKIGDREARAVDGTARLGCTTLFFRNLVLAGEGFVWQASLAVADRAVSEKPMLAQTALQSIRLAPPEGQLPFLVSGDTLRSPHYGFEIRLPGPRWKVPEHLEGPVTALELARDDQAAVAILRILKPKPGQSLEEFVADQAQQAADSLGVTRPQPTAVTLGDRPALQIVYEGKKILSGRPARCTAVYTQVDVRILALVLVAASDADAAAGQDLERLRESLKFSKPAMSN